MKHHHTHGFTLIEFSIVLVIISLLTGGIFMAQSLIRQAELRAVAGEFDSTKKSIGEFREKYMGLPGDITNAEAIWGSDAGCPGTSSNTELKTVTCNGNGSGTIGSSTSGGALGDQQEWFRAWQQLANAGFIRGMYSGAAGSEGIGEALVGVNVPASEVTGAGWTLNYMLLDSDGMLWADQYGHLLNFGAYSKGDFTRGPTLSPEEAQNLDSKIDDGSPGTGFLRAWRSAVLPECTTNDGMQSAVQYNADYQERVCSLVFLLGF